jgi:hypothetical protein
MNSSTIIFLINDHARALLATYEVDAEGRPAPRTIFKTLDPYIKVGDFVIVPTDTRHLMTVCKVVEVDHDLDMDTQSDIKWIISKVDTTAYEQIRAQEAVAIATVKSAEKAKKRADLRASVLLDSAAAIKALPISAFDGEVAVKTE